MIAFIDAHRESYGVEPMCRVLPIAPSTWHEHMRRKADPSLRSTRAEEDERLADEEAFGAADKQRVATGRIDGAARGVPVRRTPPARSPPAPCP